MKHSRIIPQDLFSRNFLLVLWTEFAGTLFFLLVSIGVVMGTGAGSFYTVPKPPGVVVYDASQLIAIAMTFGLAIAVLVWATGPISGGQLNPAVTLALVVVLRLHWLKGLLIIGAQLCGAMVGVALLRALIPAQYHNTYGANVLAGGVTLAQGIFLEALGTGLLTYVIAAIALDPKADTLIGRTTVVGPLAIGLAVLLSNLFLIPFTTCSINPARSFGPAVVGGTWNHHWVFWVGPFIGGPLGAMAHMVPNHFLSKHPKVEPAATRQALQVPNVEVGGEPEPGVHGPIGKKQPFGARAEAQMNRAAGAL